MKSDGYNKWHQSYGDHLQDVIDSFIWSYFNSTPSERDELVREKYLLCKPEEAHEV